MKRLKITSLLLSVVMCMTMAFPSIGVLADETAEPAETQTEAPEKKPETKAPEKKQTTKAPEKKQEATEPKKETPTEPKKEEPTEPKKEEPTEPKKEEPTEPKKEEPTEPKKEEPTEPKKEEPTEPKKEEPAEPEKQEPTEPEKEEPAEPEKQEPTEPEKEEPTEPEKQEPTEPEKQEPTDPETQAPDTTEPEQEPEATEVPGGKVTKTPKNYIDCKASLPDGRHLSWTMVADAEYYDIYVRSGKKSSCIEIWSGETPSVDLFQVIDVMIKEGSITKAKDNKYTVDFYAIKPDEEEEEEEIIYSRSYSITYASTASKVTQKKLTLSVSNGKLTWTGVTNTVKYSVEVRERQYDVTTNSFELYKAIDALIKERTYFNEDTIWRITVTAYDKDGVVLGYGERDFTYRSTAKPGALNSISNVRIVGDILSFNSYSSTVDYYLRIVALNSNCDSDYGFIYLGSKTSVNLRNSSLSIEEYLIDCGEISEVTDYKIEVYACDSTGNYIAVGIPNSTYHYKDANTLSVSGKTAKVKKSKVRRKKQNVKVSKVIKFKNRGQGRITYSKASGSKKISINGSNGKVTVKKKTKKGTYKVSVWVKAAGDSKHISTRKKVTFKIKVK